jgi:predicted ATPase
MLRSISIKNFRSIKTCSVTLEPLSVLVGANGSGKTNLVRAVELFGEILYTGSTEPVLEQGWEALAYRHARTASTMEFTGRLRVPYEFSQGQGVSRLGLEISVRLAHVREADDVVVRHERIRLERRVGRSRRLLSISADQTGRIHVDPGDDEDLWALAVSGPIVRNRSTRPDAGTVREALESFYDLSSRVAVSPDVFRDRNVLLLPRLFVGSDWFERVALPLVRVQRLRVESAALRGAYVSGASLAGGELGTTGEGLADAVDRLRRENRFAPVLSTMQEVLPRLQDVAPVRIQPGRKGLMFRERDMTGTLPEFAVSDGTIHTLALLVALETRPRAALRRPRILALEEPENAIHPWAQGAILRRAEQLTSAGVRQVLVTTHSAVLLDAVNPSSLFVVEHDGETTTVTPATKIRPRLAERLIATGMTLGETWQHGLLGGTPG